MLRYLNAGQVTNLREAATFKLRIVRYVSRPAAIHSLATASGPAPHSIHTDASVVRQSSGITEMSDDSGMIP